VPLRRWPFDAAANFVQVLADTITS